MNLNSLLVFLVNAADQVKPLLLALQGLLLGSQLLLLFLLAANHVLHRLSLKLVRLLLHFDHFLVLLALLLKSVGLVGVAILLFLLIEHDRLALPLAVAGQFLRPLSFLLGPLRCLVLLLVARLEVALAHFHNLDGLLLGILDFFPCLSEKKVWSRKITAQ